MQLSKPIITISYENRHRRSGEVGSHLAKLLSREEQDIILVDDDQGRLSAIDANYNLMTLRGSPTSFNVLKSAAWNHATSS